jgi:hypothetical protein
MKVSREIDVLENKILFRIDFWFNYIGDILSGLRLE